jgi:hypothetical protein
MTNPGMTRGQKLAARAGAAVLIAGVIVASYVIVRRSRPYAVEDAALRGWTLRVAEAGSPAIVALQPPQLLQEALFRQISQRAGEPVLAPEHPALSLVLQNEYADSLQGVLSTEDIIDAAKDAGIETARFEPVCLGVRKEKSSEGEGTVFFVIFEAAAFNQFRQQLTPLFPEHAGAALFDPGALGPILVVAATTRELTQWSPTSSDQAADCSVALRVR